MNAEHFVKWTRRKLFVAVLLLPFLAGGAPVPAHAQQSDFSGVWLVGFDHPALADESPVIEITQYGSLLEMDMDACDPGESVLDGTAAGSTFSVQGYDIWGDYYVIQGAVSGSGLSGSVTINGEGPVSWSAVAAAAGDACPAFSVPTAAITVDGGTGDWSGITPALRDISGDGDGTAGSDLADIYLARDETYLYARIDLNDGPPSSEKFYGISIYSHKYCREGDKYVHIDMSDSSVCINTRPEDGTEWGLSGPEGTLAVSGQTIEAQVPFSEIEAFTEAFVYAWSDYDGVDNGIDSTDFTKADFSDSGDPAGPPAGQYSYYIPYFTGESGYYSGLGLVNTGETQATVTVSVMGQTGSTLATTSKTIPAAGQKAFVVGENLTGEGWMKVNADQPLCGLCFLIYTAAPTYMADIPVSGSTYTDMVIPHVAQDDTWDTYILIANPNSASVSVQVAYVTENGTVSGTSAYSIDAGGSIKTGLSEIMQSGSAAGGSVSVSTDGEQGIVAFGLYTDLKNGGYCFAGINAVSAE